METKFGEKPDISKYLHFRWWEPVYYLDEHGKEKLGRWAGPADSIGDELCWYIVTGDTARVIARSSTCNIETAKRYDPLEHTNERLVAGFVFFVEKWGRIELRVCVFRQWGVFLVW